MTKTNQPAIEYLSVSTAYLFLIIINPGDDDAPTENALSFEIYQLCTHKQHRMVQPTSDNVSPH